MDDLISRQAAVDAIELKVKADYPIHYGLGTWVDGMVCAKGVVENIPYAYRSTEPQDITTFFTDESVVRYAPVKHGKWIIDNRQTRVDKHICSVCKQLAEIIVTDSRLVGCNDPSGETGGYFEFDEDVLLSQYCPHCGAKMDLE